MEQGPPIRGARMASAEWKAACERALTDAPSTSEPMLGTVRAHLGARIVLHVTAFYRDLLHVCEMSLAGPLTTSTLARFRVAEGGTELVGADPEIEFANTDGVNPWALVRRVLPPFEEYTADGPDSSTEAAPLTIDDETGARLRELLASDDFDAARVREALPREWRDLQVADSAASVKLFLKDADGAVTAVKTAAWFRGHRTGLIRLKSVEGLPLLERVPAGDVSRTVQWLVLGALDAAGQERSDG